MFNSNENEKKLHRKIKMTEQKRCQGHQRRDKAEWKFMLILYRTQQLFAVPFAFDLIFNWISLEERGQKPKKWIWTSIRELGKHRTDFNFFHRKKRKLIFWRNQDKINFFNATKRQEDKKQDNMLRALKFESFSFAPLDYLIVSHIIKIDSYSINKVCVCLLDIRVGCRSHFYTLLHVVENLAWRYYVDIFVNFHHLFSSLAYPFLSHSITNGLFFLFFVVIRSVKTIMRHLSHLRLTAVVRWRVRANTCVPHPELAIDLGKNDESFRVLIWMDDWTARGCIRRSRFAAGFACAWSLWRSCRLTRRERETEILIDSF